MDTERITAPGRAARPHVVRGLLYGAVAIAGIVTASMGRLFDEGRGVDKVQATATSRTLALTGAAALLVGGVFATRCFARAVRRAMEETTGDARGAALGTVVMFVGYVIVALSVLSALDVDMQGLLLGGALTGVVVGIAAQQTLGNFFAGVVLLVVRPFTIGDRVVLKSGALGGEYDGAVTEMTLFYVRMVTDRGPVALPNSGVLAAAVGPGARSADPEPEPDDEGAGGTPPVA
ncbi:MAG: mechanosensitive ion channel family protein [Actinomycetota bacterium]|nr:mechanosensitive ion channel family protein [Actinomycetota bacterium]